MRRPCEGPWGHADSAAQVPRPAQAVDEDVEVVARDAAGEENKILPRILAHDRGGVVDADLLAELPEHLLEVHARLAEVLQGAVQVEAVDVLEGLDAVPDPHRLREPGAVADGADLEAEVCVAEKAVRVVDDLGVVPGG